MLGLFSRPTENRAQSPGWMYYASTTLGNAAGITCLPSVHDFDAPGLKRPINPGDRAATAPSSAVRYRQV